VKIVVKRKKLSTKLYNQPQKGKFLNLLANILILTSLLGLFFTFGPVVLQEANYALRNIFKKTYTVKESASESETTVKELVPPNFDFSIVIPKIGAVAPVFANTDPFNPAEFLPVLRQGVAHAKGTAFPGTNGNTYIFAHSTDAFYNVGRYNAVFYLLGKLEANDEVFLYYKNQKFTYRVYDKKIVNPEAVGYLGTLKKNANTLTLQTCYPPGTTLLRLIVLAERSVQ